MPPNAGNTNATALRARGVGGAELGRGQHRQNTTIDPISTLLHALESTTGRTPSRAGKGYRSRCPSCGGRSEKVSITEATNGAVLLHAFCGCEPAAVLGACGLTLGNLFPARLDDLSPESRRAARQAMRESSWRSALGVAEHEATVVLIASAELLAGRPLSTDDHERVAQAVERLTGAREVMRGA